MSTAARKQAPPAPQAPPAADRGRHDFMAEDPSWPEPDRALWALLRQGRAHSEAILAARAQGAGASGVNKFGVGFIYLAVDALSPDDMERFICQGPPIGAAAQKAALRFASRLLDTGTIHRSLQAAFERSEAMRQEIAALSEAAKPSAKTTPKPRV